MKQPSISTIALVFTLLLISMAVYCAKGAPAADIPGHPTNAPAVKTPPASPPAAATVSNLTKANAALASALASMSQTLAATKQDYDELVVSGAAKLSPAPKVAVAPVTNAPILVTNGYQATFAPTKIAGLQAQFLSSPTLANPVWTPWLTTNYPTNGGTMSANLVSSNLELFVRVRYHFPYTNGGN